MAKQENKLKSGQKMDDGTIYVGTLKDGRQIYTTPTDLDVTATFNEAVQAIDKLNTEKFLGHDDWRLPTKEELKKVQKSRRKGELHGSFKTAGKSKLSRFHWSSTVQAESPNWAYTYRFSMIPSWSWFRIALDENEKENPFRKKTDNVLFKISTRPVRVVTP